MDATVYILLGSYVVNCAVALVVSPPIVGCLPDRFQPGGRHAWLGTVVWLLSIVFSPLLLVGLALYLPVHWAVDLAHRCLHGRCTACAALRDQKTRKEEHKKEKRAKKASDDLLEAGCNFEDSILSASDMPPMYEDCLFKAASTSPSPRSSLF